MCPIYKYFKKCYQEEAFTKIRYELSDEGYCSVYGHDKFLMLYVTKALADQVVSNAQQKASKFIK